MTTFHDQQTETLLARAAEGDDDAVAELFHRQRPRLRQLVAVRIDGRLAARVDPSDVIQEALLDASQALGKYLQDRPLPFYPWLRQIVLGRLMRVHRFHLQAQRRSVDREIGHPVGDRSSLELAREFVSSGAAPDSLAMREENHLAVEAALEHLSATDREILVLRYAERLTAAESAAVLGISPNACAQRHLRAVQRLRRLLSSSQDRS